MSRFVQQHRVWVALCLTAIALFVAQGCSDTAKPTTSAARGEAAKGRSQLWAENCTRCHENRSPSIYGDREWEVAMMHMKLRANLTAVEYREITEFLKSANH